MRPEFRADDHSYWLDGKRLAGVTSVIEDACQSFANIPDKYLLPAQWRGTVVHRATELLDLECLDWDTLDSDWHGYVRSWQVFREAHKVEIDLIEEMVWDPKLGYAGTLDRVGSLVWKKRRRAALIDIKTGQPSKGTAVQTAAYENADSFKSKVSMRIGVHLQADGSAPKLVEYTGNGDFTVFMAMLKVYTWKRGSK